MSATINLRDFYPSEYKSDYFIEVSEEVAVELIADKRYEKAYQRRTFYNRAHYSLDVEDGIEASALACNIANPEFLLAMKERYCGLCRALNSLPEIQGRRIDAYFFGNKTQAEIAADEGVCEEAVRKSISKGIAAMKKYFQNIEKGGWVLPCKSHGI